MKFSGIIIRYYNGYPYFRGVKYQNLDEFFQKHPILKDTKTFIEYGGKILLGDTDKDYNIMGE